LVAFEVGYSQKESRRLNQLFSLDNKGRHQLDGSLEAMLSGSSSSLCWSELGSVDVLNKRLSFLQANYINLPSLVKLAQLLFPWEKPEDICHFSISAKNGFFLEEKKGLKKKINHRPVNFKEKSI
jgi:hypothetical protein